MEPPPLIAVDNLTAPPVNAGAPVLHGVTFSVRPGERVVLTGPSGSGKSTLLRCMVLLDPADGEVRLEGDLVVARARAEVDAAEDRGLGRGSGPGGSGSGSGSRKVSVRTLRRRVGYLPQRPVAIAGTIAENLEFPRTLGAPALDEAAQRRLLGRLGLGDVDLSRRFDALSGGEQQRFALVRSMTARPDVLLLDEPTASLDPENVGAVLELLEEWVAECGRALVWVSHHAEQIAGLATRHVTMDSLTP